MPVSVPSCVPACNCGVRDRGTDEARKRERGRKREAREGGRKIRLGGEGRKKKDFNRGRGRKRER